MKNDLRMLEPAKYWNETLDELIKNDIEKTIKDEISNTETDEKLNIEKSDRIYECENIASFASKKEAVHKGLKIFLIVFMCLLIPFLIYAIYFLAVKKENPKMFIACVSYIPSTVSIVTGFTLIICLVTNKKTKYYNNLFSERMAEKEKLEAECIELITPFVNKLSQYQLGFFLEKFVEDIKFIDYGLEFFNHLKTKYHFDEIKNNLLNIHDYNASCLYVKTGLLFNKPFYIYKERQREMVNKIFRGSLTIFWTETYTVKGQTFTRNKSQVLTASVTKPVANYDIDVAFVYASEKLNDLIFTSEPQQIDAKNQDKYEKKIAKKYNKIDNKLKNTDTIISSNEEFEVISNFSNRNNDIQFRMAFTELAQKSYINLIKESNLFNFNHARDLKLVNNIKLSSFLQNNYLANEKKNYFDFDIRKINDKYLNFHYDFSKCFFQTISPISLIRIYQENRNEEQLLKTSANDFLSEFELEMYINRIDSKDFYNPETTHETVIYKVYQSKNKQKGNYSITAKSFKVVKRISYISVYGGNGCYHDVPVEWDDYIPLERNREVILLENIEDNPGIVINDKFKLAFTD